MQNFFLFSLLLLILSGCSHKPWLEEPLAPLKITKYQNIVEETIKANSARGFNADTIIDIKTSLNSYSFKGYLVAQYPNTGKFIVANPLGQPLYLARLSDDELLFIDVPAKTYIEEPLSEIIRKNKLPAVLATSPLPELIAARMPLSWQGPLQYFPDRKGGGFWVVKHDGTDAIFLEEDTHRIAKRQIDDIEVVYDYAKDVTKSVLPEKVTITGLSYGSTITVTLMQAAVIDHFTGGTFTLSPPPFFSRIELEK